MYFEMSHIYIYIYKNCCITYFRYNLGSILVVIMLTQTHAQLCLVISDKSLTSSDAFLCFIFPLISNEHNTIRITCK